VIIKVKKMNILIFKMGFYRKSNQFELSRTDEIYYSTILYNFNRSLASAALLFQFSQSNNPNGFLYEK